MTDAEVLAFGPRQPRPAAPDSLLRQAEEALRAVEVHNTMLSDRLHLLRSGVIARGGQPGLPAAWVVSLTATSEAMLDATGSVLELLDPDGAVTARTVASLMRHRTQTPTDPDEESPHP